MAGVWPAGAGERQAPDPLPLGHLRIVAPAAPGGGWDQTARAIQQVLLAEGLARIVQVENIAGAGGTIGLARFIRSVRRDEPALLVTGLVMASAIVANEAPVSLSQVTPIARLTGDYEVIVVPAGSPFRRMWDLVEALRAEPGAVSWAGGSAGGTDQILVALLAREVGVPPGRANYIAFSGGGAALAALLGGQVSAGVGGWSEFAPQLAAGSLRALAVSAPERVPGLDVPTLREEGYDLTLANWRGLVGPAGATAELRGQLGAVVARARASARWRELLARYGWIDLYLPSEEFGRFLQQERLSIEAVILSLRSGSDVGPLARTGARVFPVLIGAGLAVIGVALFLDGRRRHRSAAPRSETLDALRSGNWPAVAYLSLGAALDLVLLGPAGFVVASTVLFWCAARAFGSPRWLRDLAVGFALSLAAYVTFTRGLALSLPAGILAGLL